MVYSDMFLNIDDVNWLTKLALVGIYLNIKGAASVSHPISPSGAKILEMHGKGHYVCKPHHNITHSIYKPLGQWVGVLG